MPEPRELQGVFREGGPVTLAGTRESTPVSRTLGPPGLTTAPTRIGPIVERSGSTIPP